MKKGIALALALLATAVVAATAQGSREASSTATAVSCKSTLKLGLVTPLTGGAGFLGNEQASWAKYAVKTLAPRLGLKIQIVNGDTPVEQGSGVATTVAQKFIADSRVVAIIGPATSGAVAASSAGLLQRRDGAHLAVGDPHDADEDRGRQEGGHARVLPRRPGRLHPGPDGRELHDQDA